MLRRARKRPLNYTERYFASDLIQALPPSNLSTGKRNRSFFSFMVAPHPLFIDCILFHIGQIWPCHILKDVPITVETVEPDCSETSFIHSCPFVAYWHTWHLNQRQNVQLITAWQDLTRLLIKHNAAEVPVHRALCLERSVDP